MDSGRVIMSKEADSGKVFTFLIAVRGISHLHKLNLISKSRGVIKNLDKTQLDGLSTSPFFMG